MELLNQICLMFNGIASEIAFVWNEITSELIDIDPKVLGLILFIVIFKLAILTSDF